MSDSPVGGGVTGPRFDHDCEKCVFLGRLAEYDAYHCPQASVGSPTIVLRFADTPDDYVSGMHLFDRLTPALQARAQEELLKDPDVRALLNILKDAGGELHVEQVEHRFVEGEGRGG